MKEEYILLVRTNDGVIQLRLTAEKDGLLVFDFVVEDWIDTTIQATQLCRLVPMEKWHDEYIAGECESEDKPLVIKAGETIQFQRPAPTT